jgi:hypothetical protein
MVDFFTIPQYNDIDLSHPSGEDVEFYMYRAYRQCYFSDASPGMFEFFDSFMDEIHMSGRRTFTFRGFPLNQGELNNPYFVEFLLQDFQFQYMNNDWEEKCDCQNILLREMIEDG